MTDLIIDLAGEDATVLFGQCFQKLLSPSDVLALCGELGAGKTRLVKGLARGLGIDPDDVTSPTFMIISEHAGKLPLYHMDFYRLASLAEAEQIGIEEYFESEGLCVIEWADRLKPIIPDHAIWLHIEIISADERRIRIGVNKEKAQIYMATLKDFHPRMVENGAIP